MIKHKKEKIETDKFSNNRKTKSFLSSGICSIGGIPTLQVANSPLPAPVFCLFYDQAFCNVAVDSLYRHGINAFAVRNMIGVGDSRQTDESIKLAVKRLENVALIAPNAWLMIDCLFYPSEKWLIEHPEEAFITADRKILVLGKNGESNRRDYIHVPGPSIKDVKTKTLNGENLRDIFGRRRVSPFSVLFAEEACHSAEKIFELAREKGIIQRLCGFFIGCYVHGEWNLHMLAPDHSLVAINGFRRYLRMKYKTSRFLQKEWADPFITLENALPPHEYSEISLPPFILNTRHNADYRSAEAEALSEQFLIIARGIKKMDPGLIAGGFFPGANSPQSAWLRLALSSAVDFLATPIAYENRGPGCGIGSQSPFPSGYKTLGKVWFDELDTRTVTSSRKLHYRYGRSKNIAESVELLWRDAGQMLIRGHHGWWLDFGNDGIAPYSWHVKPEFLRFHSQFAGIWGLITEIDRRPLGEIKVFIPSMAARNHQILYNADMQRHTEWTLLGTPVEFDILENLLDGRSEPGKLNVIYGAASLSCEMLKSLKHCFTGNKSFVVWMGGAGLFEEGQFIDEERMNGIIPVRQKFSFLADSFVPEAIPTRQAVNWLGLSEGVRMGQHNRLFTSGFKFTSEKLNVPMQKISANWQLTLSDPDATPLARLINDSTSTVVAMKKENAITHIIYNLPILNTFVFRALAKKAGCHLFTLKDDAVCASKGLLMLHAVYSGPHQLLFPGKGQIFDLRHNECLHIKKRSITLNLKRGETRLYRWKAEGI